MFLDPNPNFSSEPNPKHGGNVWSVAISSDGQTLASCSGDTTVKLWDLAAGKQMRSLYSGFRLDEVGARNPVS
ncbi:MAG: hypothetical protein KME26_23140 [Oscillatoria princeps RMCB-10]|nr:hypothetical protein [Oscillatoria princeps RMCB-10]